MKYSVYINQFALMKFDQMMDFNDAAILNWMIDFAHSSYCEKMTDNEGVWFWFGHQKIIDDLPMLRLNSVSGVKKRIQKIIDAGIIERCSNNESKGRSYYRFGANYDLIIDSENTYPKKNEPIPKVTPTLSQKKHPPYPKSDTNYTIKDYTINDKGKTPTKNIDLFAGTENEKIDKVKETLFRNSPASKFELFERKLEEEKNLGIDIFFYHGRVLNWSNTKTKIFRSFEGWISTARNFMVTDKRAGKLEMKKTESEMLRDPLQDLKDMERIMNGDIDF